MDRLPSLTGLRGIAAVAVMLHHFNYTFLPQARISDYLPVYRAYLAVDLFFLLSGFVMAHVYGKALSEGEGIWRFAQARFARIYPLFAVTLLALVGVELATGVTSPHVSFTPKTLALHAVLLEFMNPTLSWNYPSWSIDTEVLAYVGFVPGAVILLKWKHPWFFASLALAFLLIMCLRGGGEFGPGHGLQAIARTFAGFGLGVLLWRAWRANRALTAKTAAWLLVPLVAIEVLVHFDFVIVMALGCVMMVGLESRGLLGAVLNGRPIEALGDWSYSIYLWHVPVHFAIQGLFPVNELSASEARWLAAVTTLGVIGLSALSYRFIEMPARRALARPRIKQPA